MPPIRKIWRWPTSWAFAIHELGDFQKGLVIFNEIASQDNPKYAEDVVKAKENIKLYTNNRIAKLQGENDFDGIIAFADEMLAGDPQGCAAQKIRLQALFSTRRITLA